MKKNVFRNRVVAEARKAYKKHRRKTSSQPKGNQQAKLVEAEWLEVVCSSNSLEAQVRVGQRTAIDLVDWKSGTAFELKMSGKNAGHEFYKDIFKVLAFNKTRKPGKPKIKKLVFLTESIGVRSLEADFPIQVRRMVKSDSRLGLEIEALDP